MRIPGGKLFRRLFTSSPSRSEKLARITPAILYLILIFFISSIPAGQIRPFTDDRIAHFVEYFILGVLLLIAAASFGPIQRTRRWVFAAWLFGALFAVSDEVHQMYVPGRQASWNDVLFDVLGLTASMIGIVVMLKPNLKKRRPVE